MSADVGTEQKMDVDRGRTGSVGPSGGEPALRRPRDGRQRAGSVPSARASDTPPTGLTGPLRLLLGPVTGSLRLGRGRAQGAPEQRLRVDWPQCKAHGLCAEIAPELIRLDEWGYPIVDAGALSPEDVPTARKAMQVCPTLALRLTDVPGAR